MTLSGIAVVTGGAGFIGSHIAGALASSGARVRVLDDLSTGHRENLDEMLQRIVLEGMALALTVYIPLAALYVNLRATGTWTPRLDPSDILLAPALLVGIGIAIAARRYR